MTNEEIINEAQSIAAQQDARASELKTHAVEFGRIVLEKCVKCRGNNVFYEGKLFTLEQLYDNLFNPKP